MNCHFTCLSNKQRLKIDWALNGILCKHVNPSVCVTSSWLCKVVSRETKGRACSDFTQATGSDTIRRINMHTKCSFYNIPFPLLSLKFKSKNSLSKQKCTRYSKNNIGLTSQLACYWLHMTGVWYGILIRLVLVEIVSLYRIQIIYRYKITLNISTLFSYRLPILWFSWL